MSSVTIREVADAAGVSTATVSRALSGAATVDPELAERVRISAERLGYRANRVARALRRQSTQTAGLVIPDITHPFFPAVIKAIEHELRGSGLSLLLCDAGNDVAVEAELVANLLDQQIDGLLISACDPDASRKALELAAGRVPLLQIGTPVLDEVPCASVDQAGAMRQVIEHLRGQGCGSFGYISPGPAIAMATQRLEEFLDLVRPLDPSAEKRIYLGDFSVAWGYEAARRMLASGPLPDAIVCASDRGAVGALRALRERGAAVPAGIAVTGFGDSSLALASEPQLTTVRQPLQELGARAAGMLMAVIGRQLPAPGSAVLGAELVIRESSLWSPPGR